MKCKIFAHWPFDKNEEKINEFLAAHPGINVAHMGTTMDPADPGMVGTLNVTILYEEVENGDVQDSPTDVTTRVLEELIPYIWEGDTDEENRRGLDRMAGIIEEHREELTRLGVI